MRFRTSPGGRWGVIALIATMSAAGGLLLTAKLRGDADPVPLWFLITYLCGVTAVGYNELFRRAVELKLDEGSVTAVYAFRSRRVPTTSLAQIRPSRGGGHSVVVEVRDERPIIVASHYKVADFAKALQATSAGLPIDVGWQVDLGAQLNWRKRS